MGAKTRIEWCDATFNPWVGCQKVSPACDNCYAEALATTRMGVEWGPHADRRRTAASTWKQPRAWARKAARLGIRYRVFCSSLADVFDTAVPFQWRDDLAKLIRETPELDWLLLTKRIGNADSMLMSMFGPDVPPNVWIGATIANQAEADRDIPKLLRVIQRQRISTVFLSMEPLLGPVKLPPEFLALGKRGWVIVGGESGPKARPMHPDWVRGPRDQCVQAGVAFFFKQWGEWAPADPDMPSEMQESEEIVGRLDWPMHRIGKKRAGRLLDGREWNEVPA